MPISKNASMMRSEIAVVAAAGAQRRLAALIDDWFQSNSIQFSRHGYSPPVMPPPACRGDVDGFLRDFEAFLRQHIVGDGARVERQAAVVAHAAQLGASAPVSARASSAGASARRGSVPRRRRRSCASMNSSRESLNGKARSRRYCVCTSVSSRNWSRLSVIAQCDVPKAMIPIFALR